MEALLNIDMRHVAGIEITKRYTTEEAATILGCSDSLILKLCNRQFHRPTITKDWRHWSDIGSKLKYTDPQVSKILAVSRILVFRLRKTGVLAESPLRSTVRIPGWSLIDFVQSNASFPPDGINSHLEFLTIGRCIRVPGWSLRDFIIAGCSNY